ncbi:tuftelin interacting protein 11 [Echinococcus multilocularis]|uniref:Tuftelin interacting protein 11 n=1 Tax=Echinococcus multilocularis TaxID=6211 RepID=A0A087VYU5_ECHMU|nr:tuftelin interacting protein 11 [Echinococcus multilocularis]
MDSSPEMDRFGVSEQDYEYMFDPLKRRGFTSKKQQIYGVFASDSDSETEESGMSSMASIRKRKGSNYSGPITFVSGGIKEGSKTLESVVNEEDLDVGISDEEEDKRLFSVDTRARENSSRPHVFAKPASFRSRKLTSSSTTQGFGSWERHTKGIGMKLLQKMGFKAGEGLGKAGQGIVTPVEAVKRAGKGAIGSMGPEAAAAPRRGNEPAPLPEERQGDKSGLPRYKKKLGVNGDSGSEKRSHKAIYMSADELIASVSPATPAAAIKSHGPFIQNSELSKVKVIDMTQREQRVYEGYEAALSSSSRYGRRVDEADDDVVDAESRKRERRIEGHFFEVPVLCHNIDLVIKTTEDEIRRLDRGARYEEDRTTGLQHEIDRLSRVVEKAAFDVDELAAALDLISQFESALKRGDTGSSPEACSSWLTRIRRECADLFELPALLAAVARPLLDSMLISWKPLVNPSYGVSALMEWRCALDDAGAFEILLRTSWLPSARRCVTMEWDPHDCERLLAVFEAWQSLLPEDLLQHDLLDGLVLPRLRTAVEAWNPLTDTVPIHTWLHPWLPWFGGASRLATVHEVVLHKLALCLTNWHPSDASASSVLLPWRNVIPMTQMTIFLSRNVVPKLALVMQTFQINPADQNMEPWNWVMRWLEIVDPAVIADLLERFFLPRWLHCLSEWLTQAVDSRNRHAPSTGQIFSEIGAWYSGWKGQIPPELMDYPSIKDALTKALNFMECAMRGIAPEALSYGRTPNSQLASGPPNSGTARRPPFVPLPQLPPTNLREQVEQTAAQRGFLFLPIANRFHEGKQVYRLEAQQVFFDRNVAFCFNSYDSGWHPVSFNELMAMAE